MEVCIDEQIVLDPLKEKSLIFRQFCNEYHQIFKQISWYIVPSNFYPARIINHHTDNGMEFTIQINRIPSSIEDEYNVSHEIAHAIINSRMYYPHIVVRSEFTTINDLNILQSIIDSLLHDQLVNNLLSEFYDVSDIFNKQVYRQMRDSTFDEDILTLNPTANLYMSCIYVEMLLFRDIVLRKDPEAILDYSYLNLIENRFRNIVSSSNDLYNLIVKEGYNNVESINCIFNYIIESNSLTDFLAIMNYFT